MVIWTNAKGGTDFICSTTEFDEIGVYIFNCISSFCQDAVADFFSIRQMGQSFDYLRLDSYNQLSFLQWKYIDSFGDFGDFFISEFQVCII